MNGLNKTIIVASNNANKVREIKEVLSDFPFEIKSLKEAGIDVDVDETGSTFHENAYIKASEVYKIAKGAITLADDSGLSVDTLNGAPGVYSARFAGEHGNDKKNNDKLLSLLKGKKMDERKAKFVCALVLMIDEKNVISVQGEVEGYIGFEEKGKDGFGYDPLFYIPEYKKTFAEMSPEMKNSMSHRGKALELLRNKMKEYKVIK